jgi:hypothetical protein
MWLANSAHVVCVIPVDSVCGKDVHGREHAGAQFGGVDVVEIHGRNRSDNLAKLPK